jgi:hypothetical protein
LAHSAAFAALDRLGAVAAGPVVEEYPALDGTGSVTTSIHVRIPLREGDCGDQQPWRP